MTNILIPLSEPRLNGNEWKYIKECLDTGWVSSVGSYVKRFEDMLAGYAGAKYAVARSTEHLLCTFLLLPAAVGPGDEVIVPAFTFIAPVNVVRYCGAEPLFMDCDGRTLCMDAEKLNDFLKNNTQKRKDGFTYNKDTARRIKAVIPSTCTAILAIWRR